MRLAPLEDLEQAVLPSGDQGDPGPGFGQHRGEGGADSGRGAGEQNRRPVDVHGVSCRLRQYSAEPPRNSCRLVALPVAKSSK